MKAFIAGKPLLSTTDWPSMVCCVVFFAGCNLRCRFCFNAPLLEFEASFQVDLNQVCEELDAHRFLIDGILITGGEPTLQPDPLHALAEWTHQHDLQFGLMTNGTKPGVINQLLDAKLLDYVAVDIKTIPDKKQYAFVTQTPNEILDAINKTINLLKSSQVNIEFRTTLVPSLIEELTQLEQIIDWVGAKHFVLQNFRPTDTVLDPKLKYAFSEQELERFRIFAKEKNITTRF